MMWRTKKAATEDADNVATDKAGEEETETATTTSVSDIVTKSETLSTSFVKSLWNRKTHKGEDAMQEGATSQQSEDNEEREGVKPTTASQEQIEEEVAKETKKSRWGQMWGNKKSSTAKEGQEEEDIEVEVKADSSLKIHDSSRSRTSFSSSSNRSSFGPNPDRPSVHEEAMEMLTGALLIYIFADLREMAREGVISSKDLLQEPITVSQVMQAISEHKDALKERAIDHEDLGQKLTALKEIQDSQPQSATSSTYNMSEVLSQMLQGKTAKPSETMKKAQRSTLASFHDETSTSGVVYGIAVNHVRKRVTVLFRGSVTQQDFVTDAKSKQKFIDNPAIPLAPEAAPDKIGLHSGFYQYLFKKDKEGVERLEHILIEAKQLLKENPGYTFFCTGHSLGGALASLCGFFAAMDDDLCENGPVVVISIASPQVGNRQFCDAFHTLERLKRLQYLRVSNTEDVVTHLPFMALKATAFSPLLSAVFGPGNLYKHCGVHLELKSVEEEHKAETKHFNMSHSRGNGEIADTISEEFKRSVAAARLLFQSVKPMTKGDIDAMTTFHSCKEYEARLLACKKYLSGVTIDELYQDEAIVGASLAREVSEQF